MPGPVVCQPYYNLLNRMPEVEILPACHAPWSGRDAPQPGGARCADRQKYLPGQAPEAGTRAGRGDRRMARPSSARSRWPSRKRSSSMPTSAA